MVQKLNYMTHTNVTIPLKVFISHENLNFMHVSVEKNGQFTIRFSENFNGQLTTQHTTHLHAIKTCTKCPTYTKSVVAKAAASTGGPKRNRFHHPVLTLCLRSGARGRDFERAQPCGCWKGSHTARISKCMARAQASVVFKVFISRENVHFGMCAVGQKRQKLSIPYLLPMNY